MSSQAKKSGCSPAIQGPFTASRSRPMAALLPAAQTIKPLGYGTRRRVRRFVNWTILEKYQMPHLQYGQWHIHPMAVTYSPAALDRSSGCGMQVRGAKCVVFNTA